MAERDSPASQGELSVARVVGAHGVAGALRVALHVTDSQALRVGLPVELRDGDGTERLRSEITRVAPKPGSSVVRIWLDDLSDRAQAEALRECEVWVDRAHLPELAEDEYYLADVIGLEVVEEGKVLGTVVGVRDNRAQDLLEIESRAPDGQTISWLLPAVPEIVLEVDEHAVRVSVPPGMRPEDVAGDHA